VLSVGEGVFETSVDTLESLGADSLLGTTSLGVLVLKSSLAGDTSGNDSLGFESTLGLGVGVELLHEGAVLQGVLVGGLLDNSVVTDGTELTLNLVRVDDSGEISAGHHASVELVSALFNTLLAVGSEDVVEVGESILGEDNESAHVATGGELEEVKSVNGAGVNAGEVAGGSLDKGVLVTVDNKGSLGHLEAGVSLLVGASTG